MFFAPLYNDDVIRKNYSKVEPNRLQRKTAKHWIDKIKNKELKNETDNYDLFRDEILIKLLGYPPEEIKKNEAYVEFSVTDSSEITHVVFEAKGTKTKDLFARQFYGKQELEHPVWQTINDMQRFSPPSKYGICTNYNDFVLLDGKKGVTKCHRFTFTDIENNEEKLREFLGIFSYQKLVIEKSLVTLYEKSLSVEKNFTEEFYKLFHETRLFLMAAFEEKEGVTKGQSIHYAQLFLNRIIFIFFAGAKGIVPDSQLLTNRLYAILKSVDFTEHSKKMYAEITELFVSFEKGDTRLEIPVFKGDLFSGELPSTVYFSDLKDPDFFSEWRQNSALPKSRKLNEKAQKIVNKYKNHLNPIVSNLLLMDSFDFNSEVNVDILGHIFEQSIGDLEELRKEGKTIRKKDGVYYTREDITEFICRNTIIPYLSKSNVNDSYELVLEYADNIDELETKFQNLKILDPACGSGSFLIKAIEILLEIDEEIQFFKEHKGDNISVKKRKASKDTQDYKLDKWYTSESKKIIKNNIYGVDLNRESVDITKLSLLLKIASKDGELISLSDKIKVGDSILDDNPKYDHAVTWEKKFPDVMSNGKFDIIIGNPPYFKVLSDHPMTDSQDYEEIHCGKMNSAPLFINKSLKLLKDQGKIGLIVLKALCYVDSWEKIRSKLFEKTSLDFMIDCRKATKDAKIEQVIMIATNKHHPDSSFKVGKIKDFKVGKTKDFEFEINGSIKQNFAQENNAVFLESDPVSYDIRQKMISNSELLGAILNVVLVYNQKGYQKYSAFHKEKNPNDLMFLRGDDIQRYAIRHPLYLKKDDAELNEFYKEINRLSAPHMVAQRIIAHISEHIKLTATIAGDGAFTFNSVTNMIIKDSAHEQYDYPYLLGLLNSKLISYYTHKFIYHNAIRSMDFYKSYADNIPISKPRENQKDELSQKVKKLILLTSEFDGKNQKIYDHIMASFNIDKINNKLSTAYRHPFSDFTAELKKTHKIELPKETHDEWEKYFTQSANELNPLEQKIQNLDAEIDLFVYALYGLTDNEIKCVEDNFID